jgi:hypothetical protein
MVASICCDNLFKRLLPRIIKMQNIAEEAEATRAMIAMVIKQF